MAKKKNDVMEEEFNGFEESNDGLKCCLKNKKINVRFVPKQRGNITNPKHVLYGGMHEGAKKTFVVPKLRSGTFVNVLTNDEKEYLEHIMGLEDGTLSVHKRENNFWSSANKKGISSVTLTKGDNILDLSSPEDYIKYKICLAWKDIIAPSMQYMEDHPRPTYQFVIIDEEDNVDTDVIKMNNTMKCYKEYGKVENNKPVLKLIIETITGRPIANNTKLEWLQVKTNELIQADSKMFLKIITDPDLDAKVLIRECVEYGLIANRDGHYYIKEDNSPMCENGEESTLNVAAKYIMKPKRQELYLSLQAKLSEAKNKE